jgi:hypothetical protein
VRLRAHHLQRLDFTPYRKRLHSGHSASLAMGASVPASRGTKPGAHGEAGDANIGRKSLIGLSRAAHRGGRHR